MDKDELTMGEVVEKTKQLLNNLEATGVQAVPVKTRRASAGSNRAQRERTNTRKLKPIREKALQCRACRLCEARKTVVFGEGSLAADLVFVGEGPGRDEDLQGRPFVGRAGQLLTKMIEAMKLTREAVYIMNVVKCRPPQNRPPQPDEINACRDYMETQLKTIHPRVIVALGRTSANALLETDAPMKQLRGKLLEWNEIPLMVTFHPAYLLRNPAAKVDVWADMKEVMKLLSQG
jgi:uracil-DNA glycosylase